jgi:hypothetical protein
MQGARSQQVLHFFLQLELLSLEFLKSQGVGSRPSVLVQDFAFEGLVTRTEFTNTGFDSHDRASMLLALEVNTRSEGLSDHKRVRAGYKGLAPIAQA